MAHNPYTRSRGFVKTPTAKSLGSHGSYSASHVLSPHQFKASGTGFRTILRLGNTRIINSKKGATITQGGASGYRMGMGGRITHRQNFK